LVKKDKFQWDKENLEIKADLCNISYYYLARINISEFKRIIC